MQEFIPFDAGAGTYAIRHRNYGVSTDWDFLISTSDINLLSADGIQCDFANDTAYYKVIKNGIIHQLAFNKTGIHYHTYDGTNWTLIWDK